jgi:hypothetical protein
MSDEEPIQVPIVFIGADEIPVHYANQFVVQHEQNEFFLTVGTVTPPILLGSEEERLRQASQLSYIPIRVVARIAMTRDRLTELIGVLQANLKTFDERGDN